MRLTRLYADGEGDSRFEDIEIALRSAGEIGRLSSALPAESLIFRETGGDYNYDFHHAPARQLIVLLDGIIEIETSLGERRSFSAGDLLLVEDTEGKGHRTKSVDGNLRRSLFITLEDGYELSELTE